MKHNGITLIALIITIIVMLILVGVTINMSIGDGGIISKAQHGKKQEEIAIEQETLLEAVVGAIAENDATIDGTKLVNILGTEWQVSEGNAPYTCESPKGNTFTVLENGQIIIGEVPTPGETNQWAKWGITNIETDVSYKATDGRGNVCEYIFYYDGSLYADMGTPATLNAIDVYTMMTGKASIEEDEEKNSKIIEEGAEQVVYVPDSGLMEFNKPDKTGFDFTTDARGEKLEFKK